MISIILKIYAIFMIILFFIVIFNIKNETENEVEYDIKDFKLKPQIETYDDRIVVRLFITDIKIPVNNAWKRYYEKELLFSDKVREFLRYKFPFLSSTEIKEQFGELEIPSDFKVRYETGVYEIDKDKLEEIGKFIKYVKGYIEKGYRKCKKLNDERKKIAFKE